MTDYQKVEKQSGKSPNKQLTIRHCLVAVMRGMEIKMKPVTSADKKTSQGKKNVSADFLPGPLSAEKNEVVTDK